MGPISTESFSGNPFILTFVDDNSRKVFVMPIKRKPNVLDEFIRFKKLAENQCNAKIKILLTDNGTEYTNKKFEQYLADCGIQHQKTTPYTPEQNGVAELINRTIIEQVECMLSDAGLDNAYWAKEMFSGRKPYLKHLSVFWN